MLSVNLYYLFTSLYRIIKMIFTNSIKLVAMTNKQVDSIDKLFELFSKK